MVERVGIEVFVDPRKAVSGAKSAERSLSTLEAQAGRTEREFRSLNSTGALLKRGLAGIAASLSIREVTQYSDAWSSVQNRLRQVTSTQAELASSTRAVVDIAKETRSNLEATAALYARTSRQADKLGLSQAQVAKFTKAFNQELQTSGASAAEASSAILQTSQAINAGFLAGDELSSLRETAPGILKAIADEAGVTTGELKQMGAEGKISADLIVKAMLNAADRIDNEFTKSVATAASQMEVARTITTQWVGENKTLTGGVQALSQGVVILAENLDGVATAGALALAAFSARKIGPVVRELAFAAKQTAALSASARDGSVVILNSKKADEQKALSARGVADSQALAAKSTQARAASELAGLKATQAALVAERELEVARLQGHKIISGERLRRIAEIRMSEAALARQAAAAETQLNAAKTASVAATSKATAAAVAHNAALAQTTVAARAAAIATRAGAGAMALLGGPAGVAILGAYAVYELAQAFDDTEEKAKEAKDEIDAFTGALKDMNDTQRQTSLQNATADLSDNLREQAKIHERLLELNGNTAGVAVQRNKLQEAMNRLQREELALSEKQQAAFNSRMPEFTPDASPGIEAAGVSATADEASGKIEQAGDGLRDKVASAIEDLRRQLSDGSRDGSVLASIRFEIDQGSLQGVSEQASQTLQNLAGQIDARNALAKAAEEEARVLEQAAINLASLEQDLLTPVERINQAYEQRKQIIEEAGLSEARSLELNAKIAAQKTEELRKIKEQEVVGFDAIFGKGSLENLFSDFNNIEANFKGLLIRMVAEAAQAQILQGLGFSSGGKSSFTDLAGSFVGSFFGAGKANGGRFGPGEAFPVNERGPELATIGNQQFLMTNGSRGNITPNEQIKQSTTRIINAPITVIASEPSRFKKAERQITVDLKRRLA